MGNNHSRFFEYCKEGDVENVKDYLTSNKSAANAKDRVYNITPLHLAAQNGHTAIVRLLLNAGADKDAKNINNCTPFHFAARYGHTSIVQLLLNTGAEKDVKDNIDWTPLHYAAHNGHTAVVQLLLNAGAENDVKDNVGCTALFYAQSKGHTQVVEYLEAVQHWERRRYFLLLVDTCYIVSATPVDPLLLRRRSDADRVEQLLHLLNDTDVLQLTSSVGEEDEERLVVHLSISEVFANRGIVQLIATFLT